MGGADQDSRQAKENNNISSRCFVNPAQPNNAIGGNFTCDQFSVAATFFTPVVDSMEECFLAGRTGVKNDVEAKQI